MKQKYTKPTLIKETFAMSQSIAHNCGKMLNFSQATSTSKSSCGWDVDGNHETTADVIFMDAEACVIKTLYFNELCYNNPAGGYNVFNS